MWTTNASNVYTLWLYTRQHNWVLKIWPLRIPEHMKIENCAIEMVNVAADADCQTMTCADCIMGEAG